MSSVARLIVVVQILVRLDMGSECFSDERDFIWMYEVGYEHYALGLRTTRALYRDAATNRAGRGEVTIMKGVLVSWN